MALGVSLSIKIVEDGTDTGELGRWLDMLSNPTALKDMTFIRLPGTSQSGPCTECSQYFGVLHDGSGKDTPVIPLHVNCVCQDIPVELAAAAGNAPEPLKRGEWLESRSTQEKQQILGKGRTALLESGAVSLKDIYKRSGTPLARGKPLQAIAARLARAPRGQLAKAARKAGIDPDGLTRDQIINELAGRRVRDAEPVE